LDDAGDEIGSAAGRERHDHHDWLIGVVAGVLGAGCRAQQEKQRAAESHRDAGSNSLWCHGSLFC
jgi:hypothetical protein